MLEVATVLDIVTQQMLVTMLMVIAIAICVFLVVQKGSDADSAYAIPAIKNGTKTPTKTSDSNQRIDLALSCQHLDLRL